MACQNFLRARFSALWSVVFAVTFICCSLLIYHSLIQYGKICSLSTGCSISSVKQAAKLSSGECKSVCTTQACIEIANTVISYMNTSADPCEDFHAFACGNYQAQYDQEDSESVIESLSGVLNRIIKDIIEASEANGNPNSAAQKLKTVYDSCMDTSSNALTDIRSIQSFLNKIGIKNWPHLDSNFTFTNPTLDEVLGTLLTFDESVFVKFSLVGEPSERTSELLNMSVEIVQHIDFGIQGEDLCKIVSDILVYAGMDDKDIKTTLESLIDVEMRLEKNLSSSNYGDDVDVYINCTQVNGQNKSMVCKILNSLARQEGLSYRINTEGLLTNEDADYMERLSNLLDNHNHRTLAHYIAVRVFLNNLKDMNVLLRMKIIRVMDDIYRVDLRYNYIMEKERWKFCVSWIATNMQLLLGHMYVTEMWPTESIDRLDDLFHEVQNVTFKLWQAHDLISESGRNKILQVVKDETNGIIEIIEMFQNRTIVDNAYKQFHPLKNDFLLNVMNHKKRNFISYHPCNRVEILMVVLEREYFTVNAFSGRDVNLMFGILLPPIYRYSDPWLFNIAMIGQIIAHEIGHTVFLVLSESKNDTKTERYFEENTKCRADQYFKFEMKKIGKYVDGNETTDENFADNMGVQVSETVVREVLRNMTDNKFALPGLDFSPEKLFYIYHAQAWCSVTNTQDEWDSFNYDQHSPPEFRLIGMLQASQKFSEVFSCPKVSYMNPQKKCPVFY